MTGRRAPGQWETIALTDKLEADVIAKDKRIAELEAFTDKVDAIRNSIIGRQGFNWSMHAYPLVAALRKIGREGVGHELAKKKAEAEAKRWAQELESERIAELETDKRDCEECSGLAQKDVNELVALSLSRKERVVELESLLQLTVDAADGRITELENQKDDNDA